MKFDPSWFGYDRSRPLDDEVLIFGERLPRRSGVEDSLLASHTAYMERRNPLIGPAVRRADQAYSHLWDLMGLPESERREAVGRAPYRDLLVADLLLQESARQVSQCPERAEEMAMTAEWIADQPWPGATARAREIQALACARQGDARRLLGDAPGAELRFGAAFGILRELSVSDVHLTFCEALAHLREEQGRLDEAIGLLWQAAALVARLWKISGVSYLVRLGFLYFRQNEPAFAMTVLTEVCARMERSGQARWLGPTVDLGRAVCLVAAGLSVPAKQVLEESLPARRLLHDLDLRLSLEWLECRIAIHLGDLDRGIARLEAVRRWLLDDFRFEEVCLSTLDLAFAYARRGEALEQLPRLRAGVAGLPFAEERPWALEALERFREALEREGGEPEAAAREAAEIARRGRSCDGPQGPAACRSRRWSQHRRRRQEVPRFGCEDF